MCYFSAFSTLLSAFSALLFSLHCTALCTAFSALLSAFSALHCRSMEVQMTDFENAAFTVFVVLVTRVVLAFDLNLYIPLSKVGWARPMYCILC